MKAVKVVIFTDVGGVFTSDPKKNSNATLIQEMTRSQADKMAKLGHEVLHPRCMEVFDKADKTIIYVRDTSHPSLHGTRIVRDLKG
jgi:aspartokinase